MTPADIARLRLHNQRIASAALSTPGEVVRWLGAVQAQDYLGALWALSLRMPPTTERAVEQAVADGSILRTHILRPTWHFVAPEDIRWMLALTGPRIRMANARGNRDFGLDDALLARTNDVIAEALTGGKQLTRAELGEALAQAGIVVDSHRLARVVMEAEIFGVVCSGARRGKQFTYALLDERVPAGEPFDRDGAVADLTLRYFTSHGPATIKDFNWWSGLTVTDARRGIEAAGDKLVSETVDGKTYWMAPPESGTSDPIDATHFLPGFDEYLVSYNDRTASLALEHHGAWNGGNAVFTNTVVWDGRVVGFWKRTLKKDTVAVEVARLDGLTEGHGESLRAAVDRYGAFLGLKAAMTVTSEELRSSKAAV